MKKFLALVLALVMTMSLVTISAGAEDFTDAADVTYEEAVDVMTAIGVVTGDTTGAFNPTNGLTRGAAAKIICNLILGPTTAGALNADTAPYADVAVDNVFAGYIAYCAQEGIISGYADGTFKPAAPLTGYAFMKMLLGALGYDAVKEGYVGSNWSIAVAKQALALGLDDGLVGNFSGAKALTREEACLYALNTLSAQMVKYENDSTITVGDIVINNNSKAEGETVTVGGTEYPVLFMEKYFADLSVNNTTAVSAFDAPANTWSWKNEDVGTYAKDAAKVFTAEVKYGDLYSAIGSNAIAKKDTFKVFVDGKDVSSSYTFSNIAKGSETAVAGTGNGVTTSVYVVKDGATYDITITIVNTYFAKVQKVTAETAAKDRFVTLSASTGTDAHDVNSSATMVNWEFTTEEFAKDDYVTYTVAETATGDQYKIQSVALAEKVGEVAISAYKNTSATSNFTADGVTYKYNAVNEKNGAVDLDNVVDVYMDANGYVVAVLLYSGAMDTSNYLVLTDVATKTSLSTSVIANAVTLDGKELDSITLGKLGTAKIDATSDVTTDTVIYQFAVDSEGKYNLKAVTGTYDDVNLTGTVDKTVGSTAYAFYQGKLTVGKVGSTQYTADKETIFVVNDTSANGGVKVYNGISAMTNIVRSNVAYIDVLVKAAEPTKAVVVYVEALDTEAGKASAEDLIYILDEKYVATKSGDDVIYTYAALVNGVETTISSKNAALGVVDAKDLYYISVYDGEYVETIVDAATSTGAPEDYTITNVTGTTTATYSNGVVTFTGTNGTTVVLDEECAMFSIDKLGVVTELEAEDLTTDYNREYWVVEYTADDVTTAVAIYVQVV